MDTKTSIQGARLHQLITAKKIKNGRQFALAFNIDVSHFNKILNGEMALPHKHAVKISNQYGVPVNWLLGEDVPDPLEVTNNILLEPADVQIHGIEDDITSIVNNPKLSDKEKIEILSLQLNIERLANAELRARLLLNQKISKG